MKLFRSIAAMAVLFVGLVFNTACVFAGEAVADCPPPETEQITADESLIERDNNTENRLIAFSVLDDMEYPVDENGHTKQIKTSNNPDDQYIFTIDGDTISFTGKDSSDKIKFWPQLRLDGTNKLTQQIFSKKSDSSLSYNINVSSLADGTYMLNIYANDGTTNSYGAVVYNQITFVKNGSDSYFMVSADVYNNNIAFIEKNYRSPQYYLTQVFPSSYTKWVYTNDTVKGWAEEITAGCTTDYEKIRAVHDWVADNIYYDYDYFKGVESDTPLTPEDVYNKRYSVCQGYSNLSASLLRSIGIPCKVAEGYGKTGTTDWSEIPESSSNHAWNEAWLEDEKRWVIFDSTWDSGNKKGYETEYTLVEGASKKTYFDVSQQLFSGNHRVTDYARVLYSNLGNVNGDNAVDNGDVAAFLRHFGGIEGLSGSVLTESIADVDGNKTIDFADVIAVAKKIIFDKYV